MKIRSDVSVRLVVLLHGVGASGSDLAPLGAAWKRMLPETAFACPDAPEPHDDGPQRQWFSLSGVTPENRPARVAAARDGFDRLLERTLREHGFRDRLDRVALVGFSQGASVAFDALASGRWPVAGLVALSGRFATPEPLAPPCGTPVLIVHGAADPVVPATEADTATSRLRAAGYAVETHVLANVGHTIAPEAALRAGRFLRRVLAARVA